MEGTLRSFQEALGKIDIFKGIHMPFAIIDRSLIKIYHFILLINH